MSAFAYTVNIFVIVLSIYLSLHQFWIYVFFSMPVLEKVSISVEWGFEVIEFSMYRVESIRALPLFYFHLWIDISSKIWNTQNTNAFWNRAESKFIRFIDFLSAQVTQTKICAFQCVCIFVKCWYCALFVAIYFCISVSCLIFELSCIECLEWAIQRFFFY